MADPPSSDSPHADSREASALAVAVVTLAVLVEAALASVGKALSVDDYFRVHHALAFLERPAFALSSMWLPGHSWVVGAMVGLTDETFFTPRILGLACALGATLVAAAATENRAEGAVAAVLVASSPILVLVAPTALSEPVFLLASLACARSLARFRARGTIGDALAAALFASFAATLRLEGWFLLPVAGWFIASNGEHATRRAARLATASLLLVFPLLWLDHVAAREGNALAFLDAVATDRFGRGDLRLALEGPGSMAALVALGSFAALLVAIARDRRPAMRVHQALALALALASFLAVASGNVPSQLPIRLFLAPTVLAAVPIAGLVGRSIHRVTLGALATLGLLTGALLFGATPDVMPAGARAIGLRLQAELARDGDAHALLDGTFPDITAVEVAASTPRRLHIEGSRRRCPIRLLSCDSPCRSRPEFADQVRFVVLESARPRPLAIAAAAGFVPLAQAGRYQLQQRPRGAPPLCPTPARAH